MYRKFAVVIFSAGLMLTLSRVKLAGQDTLRVDVNLVNVFATVQNPRGEFVQGLAADDFRIYEDDVEKKITVFEKDDRIESAIGILMDNSGSMVDILPIMKTGVLDFAQKAKPSDEFFVMTFGTRVQMLLDTHQPVQNLEAAFKTLEARGTCVFFDALLLGMTRVGRSEHERKALIVFTDGNDNGSKAGFGAVSLASQRASVILYFVPIGPRVHIDRPTVESLAAQSGGRVIYLEKSEPIRPVMESIRTDLARQYYLGYYAPPRPGSHRIRVEVPGRDVRVRAKTGYMGS